MMRSRFAPPAPAESVLVRFAPAQDFGHWWSLDRVLHALSLSERSDGSARSVGRSTIALLISPSEANERRQLGSDFLHRFVCATPKALRLARFPVDAFQVVHEDDAGYAGAGRDAHFEWVSLAL